MVGPNSNSEQIKQVAEQRGNLYGFLSLVFKTEVTVELLQKLREPPFAASLAEIGLKVGKDIFDRDEHELVEELAVEYCTLFVAPGPVRVPPYESVYVADHQGTQTNSKGLLWGDNTVAVQETYHRCGLKISEDHYGIPDHIGLELEFMQHLIGKELAAWKADREQDALASLRLQKQFLGEHLIRWVPTFCDRVVSSAQMSFYREVARLTKGFVLLDQRIVEEWLEEKL